MLGFFIFCIQMKGLLKMNTVKEAIVAEIYDEAETIKASSTLTEQEAENLSSSNVNDNGDRDFTPPPLQNEINAASVSVPTFDDKQIETECTDLNYQVVLAANECQEEKFSANLSVIPEENQSLVIPCDPKELDNFINMGVAAVDAAKKILNKHNISAKEYQVLHQKAKEQGFIVLNAALKLSVAINSIETHEGTRSDLYPDQNRNKEQILEEDFGLTKKQARRFASLTVEAVDKEKKFANDNDEIPTLTHALKFVDAKEKKLKKDKEEALACACDDEYIQDQKIPQGKYDIIYADFNKFDKNFDLSQVANDNALFYIWADKSQLAAAINIMNNHSFEYIDCSVFIRNKSEKGGKYFQDMHRVVLVGKKGEFKPPFTYKASSVAYENEIGENNGHAYYESLIRRMYPDETILDLINTKKVQTSAEEITNAE